jgi:FkbM family methyltransferase
MTVSAAPVAAAPASRARPVSLPALRRRLWDKPAGSVVKFLDYRIRITDGPNAYMQLKDVFVRGNYRFTTDRPDPLIIDGGSNMGISILGFKRDHPGCRVIGFEPDPQIFRLLEDNLARNGAAEGVTLVQAGLAKQEGTIGFAADGSSGGRIDQGSGGSSIRVVRLSDYLCEPVDFLKLNIEGEELPVLQECADAGMLSNVRKLVVEHHGWRQGPQRLGDLLNLLDRQGFRYLVHDFDAESCGTSKPPFRLRAKAPWFCLVYAERPAVA